MHFDDHGWCIDPIAPLPPDRCYSLLAPDPASRIDAARWADHARRFFAAELTVSPDKHYPSGWPLCDAATLTVAGAPVDLSTLPADRAPEVIAAANAAAQAMGGAGFDKLVARAKRIWQLAARDPSADREALLACAILSTPLLAPILAPDGALFGVKTARERLGTPG